MEVGVAAPSRAASDRILLWARAPEKPRVQHVYSLQTAPTTMPDLQIGQNRAWRRAVPRSQQIAAVL